MSLSRPRNVQPEDIPEKHWIGYNVHSPKLQRSSKYNSDWMYKDSIDCMNDLGDNHFSRWDMDIPENKEIK